MEKLKELSLKAQLLRGSLNLLEWDQETFLPPHAAMIRSEQIEYLAGIHHDLKTGKAWKGALKEAKKQEAKSELEEACVKQWMRDFKKDTALPTSFVQEFSKLCSQSMEVWKKARKENDFQSFAPYLEKIIEMNRKKADLLGYKKHPYDALADLYEPGITTKKIETVFNPIKKELINLVKNRKTEDLQNPLPKREYSEALQLALSRRLLELMGYDFNFGRLDISTHPFSTSMHPTDSRITTRIHLDNPLSNVLTTLHEAGHALYEMGLPLKDFGTPLCESISLGVHESQSRWWETRIGLSLPFWKGFTPILEETFNLSNLSPNDIYAFINQVKPSFIRVESDEMTYPLHVILRFEIEKGLIEGSIQVKDVPAIWNEKMKELLGIEPPTDTLGCLQDVHWSMGAFGYFPTYLLGNLYAAHLFPAFENDQPDWKSKVENRDYLFIKEWLNNKIHRFGKQYEPLVLIEKAAQKPFTSTAFTDYLKAKHMGK